MEFFYTNLLEILQIGIKIVLAYASGKLFAYALNGSRRQVFEAVLITAALLPALLMILVLEIYRLYYFGYFVIGGMALLIGFLIGRRGVKEPVLPLLPVIFTFIIGALFGLGYYRIALLGIIFGVLAFLKYGKEKYKKEL
jgi:hypothetical protein